MRKRGELSIIRTRPLSTSMTVLIALYLANLGTVGHLGGLLLWPGVALHAVVTLLLVWT